jgi:gliding-associated putative ABC transporter substrate-binding component GldG
LGSPAIVTVEVLKQMDNASLWKDKNIPLAMLLEGQFKSLYANRISQAQIDTMKKYGVEFLAESKTTDGKILVTGNGDWVLNPYNKTGPLAMGTNQYTNYNFANKDFLLNSLEYMTDESGILQSRGKEYVLRMLDPKKIETDKTFWQWLNIGLPLAVTFLAGMFFQWRRKRKYTT